MAAAASDVSKELETHLSASLRELVSTINNEKYREFEVKGATDATTMRQLGTWADHVQVQKCADATARPIFLLRFDDVQLGLAAPPAAPTAAGDDEAAPAAAASSLLPYLFLCPTAEYQIGLEHLRNNARPILLLYCTFQDISFM
jgi:hypothetical protein